MKLRIFASIIIIYLLLIVKTNAIRCIDCNICFGSTSSNIDDPKIIDCDYYCFVRNIDPYFMKLIIFLLENHQTFRRNFKRLQI